MEAKAFKKALQKNIKKMMPKMTPNWSQRGSQNGAKIIKNEVLEASCFKGGSQEASRPPPGSILERFWDHFETIFISFSNTFLMICVCILQQHVADKNVFFQESRVLCHPLLACRTHVFCVTLSSEWLEGLVLLCRRYVAKAQPKSSPAYVNELSGRRQYRLRQDRCLLLRQGAALS